MNIHNPRKQSPNINENRLKKIRTIENSILPKRKINNNDHRSNLYRFNETKNKVISQLPELFIPEEDLATFNSQLSKLTIDNSNFLNVWNSFISSITDYLNESMNYRCSIYINEQIEQCRHQVNEIYNRINSDPKQINKKITSIYKNIQSDLDSLHAKLNQPGNGKIRLISESSNLFDVFSNTLRSNYMPFFQCVSSDPKTINNVLKTTLNPILNIINCTYSILKLDEIQVDFLSQANSCTRTFTKIFNMQSPSPKKVTKSSQIPVPSSPAKRDNSKSPASPTKSKKRSLSLLSPVSQKPLAHYNSGIINVNDEGVSVKAKLRHRKSENSIISLPDFSQKKFLPNKTAKPSKTGKTRKGSKSDYDDDQENSLDTHMHSDDMYHITTGKLSDSDNDTTNVPLKPKAFRITQSKYDHLNKKFVHSPSSGLSQNEQKSSAKKSPNFAVFSPISSQLRSKREEEAKLVKTIDALSHKNDKLREHHRILKQKIGRDANLRQISSLRSEIESLKSTFDGNQFSSDQLWTNVEYMREMVEIANANIQSLSEECEHWMRINNGIESEDETAKFDNPNLRRSCESLRVKLARMKTQISENRNQKLILINVMKTADNSAIDSSESDSSTRNAAKRDTHYDPMNSFKMKKTRHKPKNDQVKVKYKQTKIPVAHKNINTNSSSSSNNNSFIENIETVDELLDAFYRIQTNTQITACEIKHLSMLYDQIKALPNPIEQKSAISFFTGSEFNGKKRLTKNVEKLEANVKRVRQTSSFSSLFNMFYSMKSNTVRMNEEITDIEKKNKVLLDEISRLSLIQSKRKTNETNTDPDLETGVGNLKRKAFDVYEQLREKSRDLIVKYFAIQKNYSNELDTAARYKIDLQLDDIQEQYTTVMMEIDRIVNTKIQEKLHTKRKIKIKGRKEIPKLLDLLEESSKFNLEAEKKAISLEKKVSSLFSSLSKSSARNKLSKRRTNMNEEEEIDNEYLEKCYMDNDEESVTRLAEVIIECKKVSEILDVIKEKTNEFMNNINKNKEGGNLKDLTSAVKSLIKNGGNVAKTKLHIVNLKKEIDYYSMLK